MKNIILIIIGLIVIIGGGYFLINGFSNNDSYTNSEKESNTTEVKQEDGGIGTETEVGAEITDETKTVIATSVEGRTVTAYHYGTGEHELLFIGGTHGGYSWNTTLVAFELMDYLEENPESIPENVMVTVIPVFNPDGLNKTVGTADRFTKADVPTSQEKTVSGRFNGNEVDLNRNFDCDWQSVGTWQNKEVSGGSSAFSEPESAGLRDYVQANDIMAAIVWYSSAGGVFASSCHNGVLPETTTITNIYAEASGYKAFEEFDFYEVTGDMVNWLAKESIPAMSVLLTTHDEVEWSKNKKGIDALLKHYAE